jgi:hypothetical protein
MAKASHATTPLSPVSPLPLAHYSGRPTWPERPTFGLKAFLCPHCGHAGQRLMRATQFWRDQSDHLCPQIHIEMDFRCGRCAQGWQIHLFNEDEGEGEIIMDVKAVETVNSEDTTAMALHRQLSQGIAPPRTP